MRSDVVPIEDVVVLIRQLEAGEGRPLLRRAMQLAPWLRHPPTSRAEEELYDAKADEIRKRGGFAYRDTVRDMRAVQPTDDPDERE